MNISMKLAILFNAGGLGDSVMTLPLFLSLKENFKSDNLSIDVYTHLPQIYSLFKEDLNIKIVKINDLYYSSPFKDFSILRKKSYDILINLVLGRKSLLQILFFKSRYKIFYIPINRTRFNILIPYFKNYSCKEPSFFKYKKIAEAITNKKIEWLYPKLKCNQETLNKVKKLIEPSLNRRIVFINPFVKESLRNLPVEFYLNLISSLKRKGYEPILIGGKDAIKVASIVAKKEHITNLAGKLSINEFICLLNLGKAFITPDSGPMHLSLLSNSNKIIALFNFINPIWRIPTFYLFKSVFPLYLYNFYYTKSLNISSCWTERDQQKAKEIYPSLMELIIRKSDLLIKAIMNLLEK